MKGVRKEKRMTVSSGITGALIYVTIIFLNSLSMCDQFLLQWHPTFKGQKQGVTQSVHCSWSHRGHSTIKMYIWLCSNHKKSQQLLGGVEKDWNGQEDRKKINESKESYVSTKDTEESGRTKWEKSSLSGFTHWFGTSKNTSESTEECTAPLPWLNWNPFKYICICMCVYTHTHTRTAEWPTFLCLHLQER